MNRKEFSRSKQARKVAGKVAVARGRFPEQMFDTGATQYQIKRLARTTSHFPEYRPQAGSRKGYFKSTGEPDRSVFIPGTGQAPAGGLALVEIKYIRNVNKVTLTERYHQYQTMHQAVRQFGNDVMAGAYFIYWERQKEFRIHDHRTIDVVPGRKALLIRRSDGKKCKEANGWPEWLKPLASCFLAPF